MEQNQENQNQTMPLPEPVGSAAEPNTAGAEPNTVAAQPSAGAEPKMQMTAGMSCYQQDKKARGMMIGLIVAAFVAIIGVAAAISFGVASSRAGAAYKKEIAKLEASLEESEGTAEVETTDDETGEVVVQTVKVLDEAVAQNLIRPYLEPFGYLYSVFDVDFDDEAKAYLAYANMDTANVSMIGGEPFVYYYNMDEEYEALFGGNLPKQSYERGYGCRRYMYRNEDGLEGFDIEIGGCGGTGSWMMSVIKDAYYQGDNIIVEVYHDRGAFCPILEENGDDSDYCFDEMGMYYTWNSAVTEFVNKFADRVPVYKMIFVKDNGHYILSNIVK